MLCIVLLPSCLSVKKNHFKNFSSGRTKKEGEKWRTIKREWIYRRLKVRYSKRVFLSWMVMFSNSSAFERVVIVSLKNFRKMITVNLHPYCINLSQLTVLFYLYEWVENLSVLYFLSILSKNLRKFHPQFYRQMHSLRFGTKNK